MKITGILKTFSRMGSALVGSTIDRTARESMSFEMKDDTLRVVVARSPHGLTVHTMRLAPGADPSDPDTIVWNDDVSLTLIPNRPTTVERGPDAVVATAEPLPF